MKLGWWRWSRRMGLGRRSVVVLFMVWMGVGVVQAGVLAQWNFNGAGDTNHPSPSAGTGIATVVGGLNSQFSAGSGSSDPAGTNDLALSLAHFPTQGHGGRTAGVQFDVSTAGHRLLHLRFDLRATATASRAGVVLVATDGVTFREVLPFFLGADGVFTNGITIPFEFFTGAADNPKFSVRIVSDYLSGTNYAAVKSGSTYSTSGTWRLDMVTFTGDPLVPPPDPPRISQAPQALELEAGSPARLEVAATGTPPLTYQWFRADAPLPGETNSILSIPSLEFGHAGSYRVRVSNGGGVATSEPVVLAVKTPTPPTIEFFSWLERPQLPAAVVTNHLADQVVRPGEGIHLVAVAHDAVGREIDWMHPWTLPDGAASWSVVESQPGTSRAELVWHPREGDAGGLVPVTLNAAVRTRDPDPSGAGVPAATAAWSIYVPTLQERQFVLTEWLPLPASDAGDNPLHRDRASLDPMRDDQFLEWVNWGGVPLDVSGWTLAGGSGVLHRFASGSQLNPTNAVVVFGAAPGSVPHLAVPAIEASEAVGLDPVFGENGLLEVRNARFLLVQRLQLDRRLVSAGISMDWEPGSENSYTQHPRLDSHWSSAGLRRSGVEWAPASSDPSGDGVESRAVLVPNDRIEVRWAPKPGVRHVVERSTSPNGPFAPVAGPTDSGSFSEALGPLGVNFYYRVRLP